MIEQMTYASVTCARTSMPASRTASSLPPMAMIDRPGVVRLRKKLMSRYTASMKSVMSWHWPEHRRADGQEASVAVDDRDLGDDVDEATYGRQRTQGDDERGDAEARDDAAVDEPHQAGGADGQDHGEWHRHGRRERSHEDR